MRIETITKTYLTFKELSDEQKDKVRQKVECEWYWFEHETDAFIKTLKAFGKLVMHAIDYSFSPTPQGDDYIRIAYIADQELINERTSSFINDPESCPLTGCYWDEELRDVMKAHTSESGTDFNNAFRDLIKTYHKACQWCLSDEYLEDYFDANGIEFDSDSLEWVHLNS